MKTIQIILISSFFLSASPGFAAEDPVGELSAAVDSVLETLYDKDLPAGERATALEATIEKNFSFAVIARRALGRNWGILNEAQQEEFVQLFTDLLIQSYSSGFEGGEKPEVKWTGKRTLKEGYIEISSEVTMDGSTFPVNYRMLVLKGNWQVYDVLVENVSLVGNYRKQFISMLPNGSPKEVESMLDTLRKKISEN